MTRRSTRTLWACTFLVATLATGDAAEGATCAISRLVGVNFGGYDPLDGRPLDSAGTIAVTCSGVQPADVIAIDLGTGGSGTYDQRELTSGVERLGYNLYLDAAHTQVWGDGLGGSSRLGPLTPLESVEMSFTVHGRVPGGQNVRPGSYSDTLVVTLHF